MAESHEHPSDGGSVHPWGLDQPEPSTFITLWPHETPPTLTEAVAALEQAFDGAIEIEDDLDSERSWTNWAVAASTDALPIPFILWCQPSEPLAEGELEDDAANSAPWAIGFETMLDPADPLTALTTVVRALGSAWPDAPAILDAAAEKWHLREAIDEIFLHPTVEPPASVLWVIHGVGRDPGDATPGGPVWLHTHGLRRCGRPDLEIVGVDASDMNTAAELLNTAAELMLEDGAPPPGDTLDVGENLTLHVRPWQDGAAGTAAGEPGSIADREEDDDHTFARAALCVPDPDGAHDWTCPHAIIAQLRDGEAAIFKTQRSTHRAAAAARKTWSDLAMVFSTFSREALAGDERDAAFLIKAAFVPQGIAGVDSAAAADDPELDVTREHIWLEIDRFDGDRAHGRLLNQPFHDVGLQRGDTAWITRAQASDWTVMSRRDGLFRPDDIDSLWAYADAHREQARTEGD